MVHDLSRAPAGFRTVLGSEGDIEVVGEAADGAAAVVFACETGLVNPVAEC